MVKPHTLVGHSFRGVASSYRVSPFYGKRDLTMKSAEARVECRLCLQPERGGRGDVESDRGRHQQRRDARRLQEQWPVGGAAGGAPGAGDPDRPLSSGPPKASAQGNNQTFIATSGSQNLENANPFHIFY